MKQFIFLICGVISIVFLSGCISGYHIGDGFPRTLPGVLFADQTSGGYIAPKMESMKDVIILGPVEATVECSELFLLVSEGNASIGKAKKLALNQYPQADDVVNVEIDVQHKSVLSILNRVIMHYRGIAIKYKR
ncbi:MAG: hypothetical protein E7050_00355 [Lentisphaerae bacterium]|nr:hypothetical protein [Lentisphaerota bacterium]